MRSFVAFTKKELLESIRSGKLVFLGILFCVFGIMNPAVAKLTPWLLEMLSEEMAESGFAVTEVTVDALTSWIQFFKNVPMALLAFILVYGSTFTKEYASQTLILIFTKGLARYKVLLSKTLVIMLVWTAGYWTCFGITYAYNSYFWDNGIVTNLASAVFDMYLFGVFVISLTVLFSVLVKNYSSVLLSTGGVVLGLYLLGLFPKLSGYMPTSLMSGGTLMADMQNASEHNVCVALTLLASVLCIVSAVPIFNKKQL